MQEQYPNPVTSSVLSFTCKGKVKRPRNQGKRLKQYVPELLRQMAIITWYS